MLTLMLRAIYGWRAFAIQIILRYAAIFHYDMPPMYLRYC